MVSPTHPLPKPSLCDCAHFLHMRAPKPSSVTRIAPQRRPIRVTVQLLLARFTREAAKAVNCHIHHREGGRKPPPHHTTPQGGGGGPIGVGKGGGARPNRDHIYIYIYIHTHTHADAHTHIYAHRHPLYMMCALHLPAARSCRSPRH